MTVDDMKRLARASLELWSIDSAGKAEDIFTPDYLNHQEPAAVGGVKGVTLDGWKAIVAENHAAFSDLDVKVLTQVAEGDLVATRWQFEATQTGAYLRRPASGKRATWTGVQIDRFTDGKIHESWVDWDKYRLFEALGFLD